MQLFGYVGRENPPPSEIKTVSIETLPSPSWYERFLPHSPVTWVLAIGNTSYVFKEIFLNNRTDLLRAFKHAQTTRAPIFSFPAADPTFAGILNPFNSLVVHYIVASQEVAKLILSSPKNYSREVIMNDFHFAAYEPVLRRVIGQPTTTKKELLEAFILTAPNDFAQQYHKAIVSYLSDLSTHVDLKTLLKPVVEKTVQQYANKGTIDARQLGRNIAMQSILELFFNLSDIDPDPLQKALDCVVDKLTNDIVRKNSSKEEKVAYEKSIQILREGIEKILTSRDIDNSILGAVPKYTELQKKALIYILLVAGVETTGTSINYLLWKLGQEKTLSKEDIRQFIDEGLKNHTPAPIIARYSKEPHKITVHYSNGNQKHFSIGANEGLLIIPELFPKDAKLDTFLFGGGSRRCPGNTFALCEMQALLECIIDHYHIMTISPKNKENLDSSCLMTRKSEPAFIRILDKT